MSSARVMASSGTSELRGHVRGRRGDRAENALEELDASGLLLVYLPDGLHDRGTAQETLKEHAVGADDDVRRELLARVERERWPSPVGLDGLDGRSAEDRASLSRRFGEDPSEVSILDGPKREWVERGDARCGTYVDEEEITPCLFEDAFFPLMRTDHGTGVV